MLISSRYFINILFYITLGESVSQTKCIHIRFLTCKVLFQYIISGYNYCIMINWNAWNICVKYKEEKMNLFNLFFMPVQKKNIFQYKNLYLMIKETWHPADTTTVCTIYNCIETISKGFLNVWIDYLCTNINSMTSDTLNNFLFINIPQAVNTLSSVNASIEEILSAYMSCLWIIDTFDILYYFVK